MRRMSPSKVFKTYLWVEMLSLFVLVPGVFAMIVHPDRAFAGLFEAVGVGWVNGIPSPVRLLMPALLIFTIWITAWLLLDPSFKKRQLWDWPAAKKELPRIIGVFLPGAAVMLGFGWLLASYTGVMTVGDGSAFLRLPREMPMAVVMILIFYPWFSAYPQEITHRAFFFHRYRRILPGRWSMIWVNAAVFAWLHAPFWHWMALAITLPGGVLFAWTYDRSRSTLAAGLEHGLYGWWAFVVGLGWFVFTGSIGS